MSAGIDFMGGNELGPDIPAAPRPGIALEAFADPSRRGHWSMPVSLERSLVEAAERLVMSRLDQRSLWWLAPSGDSAGTMRLESLPLSVDLLPLLIADD
jgi:hypothetical protein